MEPSCNLGLIFDWFGIHSPSVCNFKERLRHLKSNKSTEASYKFGGFALLPLGRCCGSISDSLWLPLGALLAPDWLPKWPQELIRFYPLKPESTRAHKQRQLVWIVPERNGQKSNSRTTAPSGSAPNSTCGCRRLGGPDGIRSPGPPSNSLCATRSDRPKEGDAYTPRVNFAFRPPKSSRTLSLAEASWWASTP